MTPGIDAIQLQRMVEALEQTNRSLEKISGTAAKGTETFARKAEDAAKRVGTSWEKSLDPKTQKKLADEYVEVWSTGFERIIMTAQEKWTDLGDWMKRQANNVVGMPGEAFRKESASLKSGLDTFKRSLLAELPFGGFLGLMMYGKMKESEFAAYGQQASQVFKSTGRVASDVAGTMGSDIRRLVTGSIIQSHAEIVAMNQAFASSGVQASAMGRNAGFSMAGFGDSVAMVSVGLDKMFQVQTGTSAKMAGQLMRDTNISLEDSLKLTRDVGLAAREAGMDFQQMTGAIMQSTSALRLQNVDGEKMGDIMMRMQSGFMGEGMNSQRAGLMASTALPALAQSVMGLSTGMQGYIGQRMAAGGMGIGHDVSPEEAIIRFQRGFRGTRGDESFFGEGLQQMLGMSKEAAGDDPFRQELALQKMFNLAPQQTQALMAIQSDTNRGLTIQQAAAKHSDELNKAFRDQALKTSDFTKWMRILRDAVARIGGGLFTILATGFESLIMVGQLGVAKMQVGVTGELPDKLYNAFFARAVQLGNQRDNAMGDIVGALGTMGNVGKQAGSMLTGSRNNAFSREFSKFSAEHGGNSDAPRAPGPQLSVDALTETVNRRLNIQGGSNLERIKISGAMRAAIRQSLDERDAFVTHKGLMLKADGQQNVTNALASIPGVEVVGGGPRNGQWTVKVSLVRKPDGAGVVAP